MRKLPVDKLIPNTWNPNELKGRMFEKLEKNVLSLRDKLIAQNKKITKLIKKGKKKAAAAVMRERVNMPPVVVRNHPSKDGFWEIIDGEHRWKVYKKNGIEEIDALVLNVDDATAKTLTINLNWLRGNKNPVKYVGVLKDLIEEGNTLEDLEQILPEDEPDMADMITTYDDGAAMKALLDAERAAGKGAPKSTVDEENTFIVLKFPVSIAQGKVIQAEIDRIGSVLQGDNVEGRALEFMAVQSSQTDLPHDLVEGMDPKVLQKRMKKRKKRKHEDVEA